MNAVTIVIASACILMIAYRLYGTFMTGVASGKCGFTTLSPFSRRFPQF
ncbi:MULTISPECIES: hypothetical protein [Bacillaceae]|nr:MULTISPECIES: hypothetical protein [Bacillaceae]MCF2650222.1 hypothetical protein [Niallia circulans]CAI9394480.1 hypothetical protein BACSP_03758 [Bacillus sp. T2.9-1]